MDEDANQPMTPRAWINSVTFSDGSTISLCDSDILVFVGPNNAGKSVALMNIMQKARDRNRQRPVVTDVGLSVAGTPDDLATWLDKNSRKIITGRSSTLYTRLDASVQEVHATNWWNHCDSGLHELAPFFFCHLTTDARLKAADPAPNIKLTEAPLAHPIHHLQVDDLLESRISGFFRRAFGEDLILHRNAGSVVPLYCGMRPVPKENEDRVSYGYVLELEKLPALQDQGDGMRSFVGVLLHSLVVEHSVILIDEPEAFLHPPQARLLGQMLVKEAPLNRQLFLATHSGDFLKGLLDSNSDRVRIVRVQRKESKNPIKELDNAGVKQVWGDPLLRYSNVLDGLFHSRVILCESDSDCRFYAAIRDAVDEGQDDDRREHIMFLHCGGKARMPIVIKALRNLDVPVTVVCDFDLLNGESPLSGVCSALNLDWAQQFKQDWSLVKRSIDQKKPELGSAEVKQQLQQLLNEVPDQGQFPDDAKRNIEGVLRRSSPWSHAKTQGKSFVPSGEAYAACDRLLTRLRESGLFLVPVGELESFCRSVGNHGPKWVNSVLERDLRQDPELEQARSFVRSLLGSES